MDKEKKRTRLQAAIREAKAQTHGLLNDCEKIESAIDELRKLIAPHLMGGSGPTFKRLDATLQTVRNELKPRFEAAREVQRLRGLLDQLNKEN